MLVLDKDSQLLTDFGLTVNQAKVYLAAAHVGVAAVSKISKASKVRREDIYRILPKLERLGLIERIIGRPTRIRAIPAEEALSILIKREKDNAEKKVAALTAKKDTFLKAFKSNYRKPQLEDEGNHFSLISETDAIINKGILMLKRAEKEIDVITSPEEFGHFLPAFREHLRTVIRKKVKVRIILEVREHENLPLRSIEDFTRLQDSLDVKYAYHSLNHYIIRDQKQVLMATSPEPPLGEHPYLWTDNKSFVGLMHENFDDLWRLGVDSKRMET